jgi:penicillin-binding protein 1A
VRGLAGAVGLILGGSAVAAEEFAFLKPEAVRAAYAADRDGWDVVPPLVVRAFVLAEDKGFWDRAPGRSTVTRTIGNWYPEPGAGPGLAVAVAIGQALEGAEIADWFVNRVYLGQRCFGVAGAAGAYFGKDVAALAVQEVAYLAILPKGPAVFHPERAGGKAVERRNWLLGQMAEAGLIAPDEARAAMDLPLGVRAPLGSCEVE